MSVVAPLDPAPIGDRVVTWSRVFAVVFLLVLAALGPLRDTAFPEPFPQRSTAKTQDTAGIWEGADAGRAAGGVFSLDPLVAAALWGTRIESEGSDAFIGEVRLEVPVPKAARLLLPVSGRTSAPNALRVRAFDARSGVVREWTHPGSDFGIDVGYWELEVPSRTARVEVILADTMSGPGGWLGVGRLAPAAAGSDFVPQPVVNVGFFLAHAVALGGFLFMPGLVMCAWMRPLAMPIAVLPLPGFAFAAASGLAISLAGPAVAGPLAMVYKLAHVLFAVLVIARRAPTYGADERHAAGLYVTLIAVVLVWSIVPLTVEREHFVGTNAAGRMVASPPDSLIPFFSAVYFLDASDGDAEPAPYFGPDWSATSRGPLSAWVILTAIKAFDLKPHEPPHIEPGAWPADREGHFVSRVAGILTNGFVMFGVLAVLQAFAPGRRDLLWFGLGWVALSPVVMINTAFLWPKLLATYFGLLAIAEVAGRRRRSMIGLWLSLSYLSHPVGVLIAAPVLFWSGVLAMRGADRFRARIAAFAAHSIRPGLWMITLAAPWLLFKFVEGKHDVFLRYPLGDGRGFETAASGGSWLACRWDNIWYSLVPGTLWRANHLVAWAGGSLSVPGHWAMNCAKTLPFGVGLAMFVLLVRWLPVRRSEILNAFRVWLIGGGFLLMVLVWGFSRDGLGRNCLEPLVVCAMIATAAAMPRVGAVARVLSVLLAVEAVGLLMFAYLANPNFRAVNVPLSAWVLLGATGAAWAVLAWLALSRPSADRVGGSS